MREKLEKEDLVSEVDASISAGLGLERGSGELDFLLKNLAWSQDKLESDERRSSEYRGVGQTLFLELSTEEAFFRKVKLGM